MSYPGSIAAYDARNVYPSKLNRMPAFGAESPIESEPESKKNSTAKKVLIGAGAALAVTGSIVGGIMYVKKAKFNKALNQIVDSINGKIKTTKNNEFIKSKFDLSQIDEEMNAVIKEAKKTKNLDALNKINKEYGFVPMMSYAEYNPVSLSKIIEESGTINAKFLKEALEGNGDFVKVRKCYASELGGVQARHYTYASKAKGKTAQETVDMFINQKLLPEGVKPHTYDLTKEMDLAVTNYTSGSGYTDYMMRQNQQTEWVRDFTENTFASYNIDPQCNPSKKLANLVSSFNDKTSGKTVVSLKLPDVGKQKGGAANMNYSIGTSSSSGSLTPLQKDLIEVGGRLNDNETIALAKLLHNKEDMDYNAILSLIQHYANDAEFMARPFQK